MPMSEPLLFVAGVATGLYLAFLARLVWVTHTECARAERKRAYWEGVIAQRERQMLRDALGEPQEDSHA